MILEIGIMLFLENKEIFNVIHIANIFSFGIICAIGVISLRRELDSIYKYLGISLLIVGFFCFLNIFKEEFFLKSGDGHSFIIEILASVTRMIIVYVAYSMHRLKIDKAKCILFNIIVVGVIFFIGIKLNEVVAMKSLKEYINFFVSIELLINGICFIYLYNKKIFKEDKGIIIYMIISTISPIIYYFGKNENLRKVEIFIALLAGVSFFILGKNIFKNTFKIDYENKERQLDAIKASKKELNEILKTRNLVLLERSLMASKSEKKYHQFMNAFNDGIIIFNYKKLIYANKISMQILGVKEIGDILGGSFEEVVLENIKEADSEKLKDNLEIYKVTSEGESEILYIKDITEAKKYQKIRYKYEEYLKKEKIKEEFFANVSHELRTPINMIKSTLDLDYKDIESGNLENVKNHSNLIRKNCFRLIRTINNFIDANRLIEGYLVPNKKIYNIVEVVETVTMSSNKYIERANFSLVFDVEEEEIFVLIDRELIERVILNLLSNSVKHGSKDTKITVSIKDKKSEVEIIVQNDGELIDFKDSVEIFEKFTKVNKNFDRGQEGSGLGLFLVKAIINVHDGEIKFEREERTNMFKINLPKKLNLNDYTLGLDKEITSIDEKVDIEFSDIYI